MRTERPVPRVPCPSFRSLLRYAHFIRFAPPLTKRSETKWREWGEREAEEVCVPQESHPFCLSLCRYARRLAPSAHPLGVHHSSASLTSLTIDRRDGFLALTSSRSLPRSCFATEGTERSERSEQRERIERVTCLPCPRLTHFFHLTPYSRSVTRSGRSRVPVTKRRGHGKPTSGTLRHK